MRRKKKTKLCERSRSAQLITIGEDRWKVLVVFTGNGSLCCHALVERNYSKLSLLRFSVTVRLVRRREAEMLLWSGISQEAWWSRLNEKEELRKVSSAKE